MAITIQGPDGASIDFPEETSEAEMSAAMAQAYPHPQSAGPGVMAGVSRALETNLPFVDRAVAAAKSALPQGYGGTGQDYAANLATERAKNAQFAEQNPWTNAVGGITAYAPAALISGGSGLWGRVGTGALTGFGLGGIQGASNSPDLTNTQETGKSIAQGESEGGALGAGFPAIAHGIGQGYSALADALRGGPSSADLAALGTAKNAAYQNVKDLGAAYSPQSFKSLTDKIASDAAEADIDPDLNPKATKIIANLQNRSAEAVKSGAPVTLTDLDKARQFVNDNLSGLPEPKQARFGSLIKDNIDDFVNTAFPGDMVPMPAKAAAAGAQGTLPLAAGPTPADVSGAAVSGAVGSRENVPSGPQERIIGSTITAGNRTFDAPNHVLAMDKAFETLGNSPDALGNFEDGFRTSTGRVVSRDEATQIAEASGQAKPRPPGMRMEARNVVTAQEMGFPAGDKQVPPVPAPTPMLDFLRRAGGLKDEGGDLSSMGFSNLNSVAAKGSSKIIDKENGVPMDEGRRMAVEAGYMEPHETVSDFINKLGEHPTYSVHDEEAVAARAARNAYDVGPQEEPASPVIEHGRAPEDFAGLGEEPPLASRPSVVTPAVPAAPSGPVASAQEAAAAIRNARDLAQRQFKANALLDALNKAKINAAKSGIGGNTENAARQRLAAILDQEPWSPDEKAQLNKMVLGTPVTNTLREASRLSPFQNTLMKVAEGTTFAGAPTTTTLAAVLGSGAHLAGNIARRRNQNELMRTILAGGKAPVQVSPRQGPVSRASMAAALAANAGLQGPRSQATPQ